ncbi:MAG: hypothetical protein QXH91_03285, partial [Candidatus Bathyarchaeia archaeon]
MHMIFVSGVSSPSDPEHEWQSDWLEFAKRLLPGEPLPDILDPKDDNFDKDAIEEWINKIVGEFCLSRKEFDYIHQISEGEKG